MNARHLLAALALGIALLVACSGGNPSASCGSYYESLVAASNRCFTPAFSIPAEKSNYENYCEAISKLSGIDDFTGQIDACATAVQSAACGSNVVCKMKGSLPDGAACGVDAQCAGGVCSMLKSFLYPDSEIQCGTCAHYVGPGEACLSYDACDPLTSVCMSTTCVAYAQIGEDCTAAKCAAPLVCSAQFGCQPVPTKGEACDMFVRCVEPYVCVGQTCVDPVQAGGACTGLECAWNLACNPQTNTCEVPQLAGSGQACGLVNDSFITCQPGLRCGGNLTGTCYAPRQQGETCTVLEHECDDHLRCVKGTCQIPDYTLCK